MAENKFGQKGGAKPTAVAQGAPGGDGRTRSASTFDVDGVPHGLEGEPPPAKGGGWGDPHGRVRSFGGN